MKIKKELVKRDVAGDIILVPVGKTVYDSNGLFVLNELGEFLWDRLEAADSEEALLGAVLEEYEVTEEIAREDIRKFLNRLRELGIL
ncbi:MAG: PqqD family protein [Oscillospiraceae bacterium]|nr:PqqD family protein [Oscillospiraceae bacterium]